MVWALVYLKEFEDWLDRQSEDLQDEALAHLELLKEIGPVLSRPHADTLKGSKIRNLKELRFTYAAAPIRILYVFDPNQHGVIILAGDKSGDKRWYEVNISKAEKLYGQHLQKLFAEREKQEKLEQEKEKRKRR
jgi:hypothetical protein